MIDESFFSSSALTCFDGVTSPYVLLITITQIAAKDKERYASELETYKKNKAEVSFSNQLYNSCCHQFQCDAFCSYSMASARTFYLA